MNILIEHAESSEFFLGEGRWTKNVAKGRCYARTEIAQQIAKREPIGTFNIVGYIPDTGQFVNLNHGRGTGAPKTEEQSAAGRPA